MGGGGGYKQRKRQGNGQDHGLTNGIVNGTRGGGEIKILLLNHWFNSGVNGARVGGK